MKHLQEVEEEVVVRIACMQQKLQSFDARSILKELQKELSHNLGWMNIDCEGLFPLNINSNSCISMRFCDTWYTWTMDGYRKDNECFSQLDKYYDGKKFKEPKDE